MNNIVKVRPRSLGKAYYTVVYWSRILSLSGVARGGALGAQTPLSALTNYSSLANTYTVHSQLIQAVSFDLE